ncbi:MAG: protein translocase subunit SecD [Chloroflexi bacterium]|nr:protein translocase subunit SecD [Chloroflexota bacterium]
MRHKHLRLLIGIVILALVAVWINLPDNPGIHVNIGGLKIDRDIKVVQGLDLQGGMQVTLEADTPPGQPVDASAMQAAKSIVENRINGLGVSEPLIQMQGDNRIIVELPGIKDPDGAIKTFGKTGLLEFIDAGITSLPSGTLVTTDLGGPDSVGQTTPSPSEAAPGSAQPTPTASPTPTTSDQTNPSQQPSATESTTGTVATPVTPSTKVYKTLMTGKNLKSAEVGFDEFNRIEINFELTDEGAKIFSDWTRANVGKYMAITMDKQVISSPVIKEVIPGPRVSISNPEAGGIPIDEARQVVIQLKYGALPIPLKVIANRTVGPTLGLDSINKSFAAGAIGLSIVALFMLVYYRMPGLLANIALVIYAGVVFALFKLIPVTLTLAGIAGFILSIGMAVDANILIFERMKEELRTGKTLGAAIDAGFARAWTSIRDSNISTLITCAILFWFGSNFGASIIKGFALTLAIGVVISMFTAITVTRTFLKTAQMVWFSDPNAMSSPRLRWLFDLSGARRYNPIVDGQQNKSLASPSVAEQPSK